MTLLRLFRSQTAEITYQYLGTVSEYSIPRYVSSVNYGTAAAATAVASAVNLTASMSSARLMSPISLDGSRKSGPIIVFFVGIDSFAGPPSPSPTDLVSFSGPGSPSFLCLRILRIIILLQESKATAEGPGHIVRRQRSYRRARLFRCHDWTRPNLRHSQDSGSTQFARSTTYERSAWDGVIM